MRLAVGLVLAAATPSQAGTTGDTTTSTLVKFMGVGATFTTAAVGNIGLTAQESGATIEFNLATWNTFPHTQFYDFLTGFVWIDLGSTAGPPDFRAEATPIRDIVGIGSPSHEYILQLGTITFSPLRPGTAAAPFEHFEVTFSAPADTHGNPVRSRTEIIRGDEFITLGVTLEQFGDPSLAIEPDIALIHMQLTGSGPLPRLPSLFTDEQKAKFQSDADALKKIGLTLGVVGASVDGNPAANLANTAASELASGISPQVGTANSTVQTALSMTDALISVPTSPISLVLSLSGMLNNTTVGILEFLANLDPPDGNYLEVFAAPDWSFGEIDGASAAGNTLVQDSWALFQESLNLLAAAERFQGADLAGNADAKAMQEAAFNAALDRYNQNRVTLSDSLIAFLAELEAVEDVEDLNLEDDTTLADLQAYLAGLTDPATEDPQLAAWIASMTVALPGLRAQPAAAEPSFIEQAVIDALVAIGNRTPSGLTGSAFAAIRNAAESLATTPDPDALPEITSHPLTQAFTAGGVSTLSVDAQGPGPLTYQWFKDGVEIPGATASNYTLPSVQSFHDGDYTVTITNANGSATSHTASVSVNAPAPNNARLLNLSTRAQAQTGDNILIPGFVVSGTGTKRLLIRAVGPTLSHAPYNIASALNNPRMALKRQDFSVNPPVYVDVDANDDWQDNTNASAITQAMANLFAFPFEDDREAALLVDLIPGQYTVFADGVASATGIAIVELYDADTGTPTSRLINISNRGFVGTGDSVMIPGFVVSQEGPKTLLIRVVGPTLAGAPYNVPGTMLDPKLEIFPQGSNTPILANDNWGDNPDAASTAQTASAVSAFALAAGSADAAFVVTLQSGTYTVVGSSADGTSTGVVLVEVYVVP